tara:strand:- start:284 stop:754 length:471 start_codon:yes stop_codon:yes gene_type:complete
MSQQITGSVDNKYLQVRNKAYNLENEIEDGEKQYKEHVMQIIHKIQSEYYKKYGAKIDELQDLMDAIDQYQNKGYRQLKRQLQKLYLEDMAGGNGNYEEKQKLMKDRSKQLYEQYREKYCPQDNFQKKRDEEAAKLQRSILGLSLDSDSGGRLRIM